MMVNLPICMILICQILLYLELLLFDHMIKLYVISNGIMVD